MKNHPQFDVNRQDEYVSQDHTCLLHIAVYSKNLDALALLLNHPKIEAFKIMSTGNTPHQLAEHLSQRSINETITFPCEKIQ